MFDRRTVLICIALQACVGMVPAYPAGHSGQERFKVFVRSRRDQDALDELRKHIKVELVKQPGNLPQPQPVEVLVSPGQKDIVQIFLKSRGLEYKVTIDDIEEAINKHAQQSSDGEDQQAGPDQFDFSDFHTLDEIYTWMLYMAEEFPNLVTLTEIGKSFEKRPLYMLKISGPDYGEEKAGIWLDAGIHSNEWITPATLIYFINQMVRGHGEDRELTWLVDNIDWYFLPMFNPDGYVYTWTKDRLWRKNRAIHHTDNANSSRCVGVDLNRNWGSHWAEANAERDPCSRMYIGPAPFSEPETEAVARFLANHNDSIKAYLAYHSFSQLWMLPYSYSKEQAPPNLEQLTIIGTQAIRALQQVHGTEYKIGKISELVGEASGASVDYTYSNLGIEYSFGIELRDLGEHGTRLPADQIIPNAQESLEALKVVGFFIIDKMAGNDDYWTG